jgi:TolA-binding protein
MKDAALETFFEVYKAEIAKLNAGHQAERRNQEKELQALSGKIDKLLDALMNGMTTTSVKQKLEELELQKQRLETELARPAPEPLVCHPETADRYRAKIASLEAAINDPEHGVAARDAVLQLIDSLRLIPRPDRGKGEFDLEVEGALGALLRAAGVAEKDAASIDAASCSESSGQLVAGARNPLKNLFCAHDVSAWRYGLQATDLAKQIEDAYQALMDGDGTFEEVPHGP